MSDIISITFHLVIVAGLYKIVTVVYAGWMPLFQVIQ